MCGKFEDFKFDQGRDRIVGGRNTQALSGSIWTGLQGWEYFLAREVLEIVRQGYHRGGAYSMESLRVEGKLGWGLMCLLMKMSGR